VIHYGNTKSTDGRGLLRGEKPSERGVAREKGELEKGQRALLAAARGKKISDYWQPGKRGATNTWRAEDWEARD